MVALCLTATPLAASRAARRLCDAEGGLLFGPTVTTIDRLAPQLLSEGGETRPLLTRLATRMIACEAGRVAGGVFSQLDPASGLCRSLAGALDELRAAQVTPDLARAAAAQLSGASGERLRALALALQVFETRLSELCVLDRALALRSATGVVRRGNSVALHSLDVLVVAGLGPLQPAEADFVLSLVEAARRSSVDLGSFVDIPSLVRPLEPLLSRLEALGTSSRGTGIEIRHRRLEEGRVLRLAALLAALGGTVRSSVEPKGDDPSCLSVRAAAGEDDEPEVVARAVGELLETGIPPEEVAVFAPAPRLMAGPLARALRDRGIPFSPGRGTPLADSPPVRIALQAFSAASCLPEMSPEAAERLTTSTYLGGRSPMGTVLAASGALLGRLNPLDALRRREESMSSPGATQSRARVTGAAQAVEEIAATLRPLGVPGSARTHASRLSAFLEYSGLRRRAGRGPTENAAADLAALESLEEAGESVARACGLVGRGHLSLTTAEFAALLGLAVEELAVPAGPAPAVGAVELFGLDESLSVSARAVVVSGCGGNWPPSPRPEAVLRDEERVALAREAGRAILPAAASRSASMRLRALAAVSAAQEKVVFTWAAPGPGGRGGPLSALVADALTSMGIPIPAGPDAEPTLETARTLAEALRALARRGASAEGYPTLAARMESALLRSRVEGERRAGARSRHAGILTGAALAALCESFPKEWSPSQLERYASCPFRLFLGKFIRLPDEDAPSLDAAARDEGTVLHRALEHLVRARLDRSEPQGPPPSQREELQAEIARAADAAIRGFEEEGRIGDPSVWAARRDVLVSRLERFVLAEAERRDSAVPIAVEYRFGGRSDHAPVALEAEGETVLLEGRIDRIDASPDRLRVVDYKSGGSGKSRFTPAPDALLDPEAFGVKSFQVPAYLLAAARAAPGRKALSARYAFLRTGDLKERDYEATGDVPQGSQEFARQVISMVRRMRTGEFPQAPGGCERCPWPAVCRPERVPLTEDGA